MKHLLRASLLYICLFLLSVSIVQAKDIPWQLERTKHFTIYYAKGKVDTAVRAGDIAERWHTKLSRKLEFSPEGSVPIYLYPDRRSFAEATGFEPNDYVVGTAHARILRIKVDASGAFTDISKIIPHELVHVFIARKLRANTSRLPLWMHEGLAKYLADDWGNDDSELLADAASGGEILPLDKISDAFPNDKRGRAVAYVESYSAVKFMVKRSGEESIPDLLSQMAEGLPFPQAFVYSTGDELAEFEDMWQKDLWEKNNINRWIRFGTGAVSATMSVLAVLAYRRRLIQKRRKAQEFEESDGADEVDC